MKFQWKRNGISERRDIASIANGADLGPSVTKEGRDEGRCVTPSIRHV